MAGKGQMGRRIKQNLKVSSVILINNSIHLRIKKTFSTGHKYFLFSPLEMIVSG